MIDLKVTTIGGKEIAAKLAQASSGVREALREELAAVGDEIVARAQADAPKRTGIMASKIAWYFGREVMRSRGKKRREQGSGAWRGKYRTVRDADKGPIQFTARPFGRVAHLVERGVNATFNQRPGPRGKDKQRRGQNAIGPFGGEAMQGPDYRYARTLRIAPRPFFVPAVDSVGGAAGVNARLQAKLDWLAGSLTRAP